MWLLAVVLLLCGFPCEAEAGSLLPPKIYTDYQLTPNATRLLIRNGKITGKDVSFTFNTPEDWSRYIFVDRMKLAPNSPVLERLHFYCASVTKSAPPALLMTIDVFNIGDFDTKTFYDTTIKTKKYIFAIVKGNPRPFVRNEDQGAFDYCYSGISTNDKLKACFEFPEGQGEQFEKCVIVKGKSIGEKIKFIDSQYCVPLREVCEALGYTVGYTSRDNSVTISYGSFSDKINLSSDSTKEGIRFKVIDGVTWISTSYFFWTLGRSVESDNKGNILVL